MEQLRSIGLSYSYRNLVRRIKIPFHDTNPSKCFKTVIAVPGTPRTHRDFKNFVELLERKHIRLISMNWPGFGECPAPPDYAAHNEERTALISDFIDKLQLNEKPIIMAHSSGAYPVVRLAAENPEKIAGLLIVCPGGQTVYRLIRPYWSIQLYARLLGIKLLRPIARSLTYAVAKMMGLSVKNGEVAAITALTAANLDLPQFQKCVAKVGSQKTFPLLMFWSQNDSFVEPERSLELCHSFQFPSILLHSTKQESLAALDAEIQRSGRIRASVCFKDAGHIAQKTEADFISDCLEKFF